MKTRSFNLINRRKIGVKNVPMEGKRCNIRDYINGEERKGDEGNKEVRESSEMGKGLR